MAKISIDDVKVRLQKDKSLYSVSKQVKAKASDNIEFVKAINDNLFIFKLNGKYVLSPADDTLAPIIGEFDELPSEGDMPPCFSDWCEEYSNEINYFQDNENNNQKYGIASNTVLKSVDLGLSVKWTTCNIGATKPEEIGDYYAWGETEVKTSYKTSTYKYYDASTGKYKDIGKNICGTEYDVAHKLNSKLSLPNIDQLRELVEKCTWTKTTLNNKNVWEVKGPNGNKIYFPICGCKSESSSVGYKENLYIMSGTMWSLSYCTVIKAVDKPELYNNNKRTGAPVRAIVIDAQNDINEPDVPTNNLVDLGLTVNWSSMNLGANSPEEFGDYYAWGETATKTDYKTSTYKYYDASTDTYKDLGNPICKTDYDVAYKLNRNLCLPTIEQATELVEKCTWTKTTLNNKTVWEVKGPNGNKIYIPISGCISESNKVSYTNNAYIWTGEKSSVKTQAKTIKVTPDGPSIATNYKRTGTIVRPVSSKTNIKENKIEPIIPYKWNQRAPYYNALPKDPKTGNTVVTGCSNTALSMIVAYYGNIGINGKRFKRGMSKTAEYITSKGKENQQTIPSLDAITMFDYDNFNYYKNADFNTAEKKKAVSELMKYIGFASKANYTSNGTGTAVANTLECIKSKLYIGPKAKIIYASSGADSFKKQILNELKQGFPVLTVGYNKTASAGHAFICDGYDPEKDKYHFNWGYSGNYDGWFDMDLLTFGGYDFSYKKCAIIGVHPEFMFADTNNDNLVNVSDIVNIIQTIIDKKAYDVKQDINSDGKINEDDIELLINYILGKNISGITK